MSDGISIQTKKTIMDSFSGILSNVSHAFFKINFMLKYLHVLSRNVSTMLMSNHLVENEIKNDVITSKRPKI